MRALQLIVSPLALVSLLLSSLATPPLATAQSDPASNPLPPLHECFNGAVPSFDNICVFVRVSQASGASAAGAEATLTRADTDETLATAFAEQPVNGQPTETAAPLRLSLNDVRPGALLALNVQLGGVERDLLVGLQPDPTTRTQEIDVVLGQQESSPAQIWGTITPVDSKDAVAGQSVSLYSGDKLLGTTTTGSVPGYPQPMFTFNPVGLKNGQRLRLVTTYYDEQSVFEVSFTWSGEPIFVPFILGWPCDGDLPRRGGGTSLPPLYCATFLAQDGNVMVEGAEVFIEAGNSFFGPVKTKPFKESLPLASLEIGEALHKLPPGSSVRVIAVFNRKVGILTLPLDTIGLGRRWGGQFVVTLQSDITAVPTFRGGTPRPIAALGENVFIGTSGGVSIWRKDRWRRLLSSSESALPSPDVSALLALPSKNSPALVAGLRSGAALVSRDLGNTWSSLLAAANRPVGGMAVTEEGVFIARGQELWLIEEMTNPAPRLVATLSFRPTALAALPDGRLVAGDEQALYIGVGSTWATLAKMSVTALAVFAQSETAMILAGTPAGLQLVTLDGQISSMGNYQAPIEGITLTRESDRTAAFVTTAEGVLKSWIDESRGGLNVTSDMNLTPIISPDVSDLQVEAGGLMTAATSTGVYTSTDNGLNWEQLPQIGTTVASQVVRSVAWLDNGSLLALTADALWRLAPEASAWQRITTNLPATGLNGMVVRTAGKYVVLGRNAGRSVSLYVSSDSAESWKAISVGANRGVSDITLIPGASGVAPMFALATLGDGLYIWSPGRTTELQQAPTLVVNGQASKMASVAIAQETDGCIILVGTMGPSAGISERPCDATAEWTRSTALEIAGRNVGLVSDLIRLGSGRYLAATSGGLFLSTSSGWGFTNFGVPIRAQALARPTKYDQLRQFAIAGRESGVLLLSDIAPDLAVTVNLPEVAKGTDVVTATVVFQNQGLLPTVSTTYTVSLLPGSSSHVSFLGKSTVAGTVASLRSGDALTLMLSLAVAQDAVPGQATIAASAPSQEQFSANNQAERSMSILYRDAPDPRVSVLAPVTLAPGASTEIRLRVINDGMLPSATAIVTMSLPLGINLVAPIGSSVSNQVLTWQAPALVPGTEATLTVPIARTSATPAALIFTAWLTPGGDDRELRNNWSRSEIRLPSDRFTGIILTYLDRMNSKGLGDSSELRLPLTEIADRENMQILDLGNGPSCTSAPANWATSENVLCHYKLWDLTRTELTKAINEGQKRTNIETRLNEIMVARRGLINQIRNRIVAMAKEIGAKEPLDLYIVGGDLVIPADSTIDISTNAATLGQSVTPEVAHLENLTVTDSLYAVLSRNHYAHYGSYGSIGGYTFEVGVQVGAVSTILPTLNAFLKSQGILDFRRGAVSGVAAELTADTQQWVCKQMRLGGLNVTTNCANIPSSGKAILPSLSSANQTGNLLSLVSGHATEDIIDDLLGADLATTALDDLNLLLLLGCHTGLPTSRDSAPTLVEAAALNQVLTVGFTAYAYAQRDSTNLSTERSAYAEQLVRDLIGVVLSGRAETLGEAMRQARQRYFQATLGSDAVGLHRKTMATFTLYGPPMYRIATDSYITSFARPSDPIPTAQQLTLTPVLSAHNTPDGSIYTASSTQGQTFLLAEMGRTIQPALIVTVPLGFTGALFDSASLRTIANVDPVVPRIAPLQGKPLYTEPGFTGSGYDWNIPPRVWRDDDEQPSLVMALGAWNGDTADQRLFDALTLELTRPSDPSAGPPVMTDQPNLCLLGKELNITIDNGANISRVEAVVFSRTSLDVYPLRLTGKTWRARVDVSEGRELFIQILGKDGTTSFITDGGRYYTAPGKVTPCRPS